MSRFSGCWMLVTPTASGMDGLPHCYSRVAAPFISAPSGTPVQPVDQSLVCSTSVESRSHRACTKDSHAFIMVRSQTHQSHPYCLAYLRRLWYDPSYTLYWSTRTHSILFINQFASRYTGSTAAATICLLHRISDKLLLTKPLELLYICMIALSFPRPSTCTVRHSHRDKFSNFPIPDNVYNWVVNFLSDRCHHIRFNGILSAIAFHFCKHRAGFGSVRAGFGSAGFPIPCYGGLRPTTPESHKSVAEICRWHRPGCSCEPFSYCAGRTEWHFAMGLW